MGDAKEAILLEQNVSAHCATIMKADSEWESKNRAILQLTTLIEDYRDGNPTVIQELFGMNIFRILKEPLKAMISDLRSQQVRDTCHLLTVLSDVLGDHMRHLLRDIFSNILDAVKVSNKVMSGYVDECVITLIRNTTFKAAIPVLISELSQSKAKIYRERCMDYVNEILVSWDITEKDADALIEAIRIGLEDAAVRGREIARLAYLNMFQLYPKKTEKLKASMNNKTLSIRLDKEETEFKAAEQLRRETELRLEAENDCMPAIGAFSRQSILSTFNSSSKGYESAPVTVGVQAFAQLVGPVGRLSVGGERASNFFAIAKTNVIDTNSQINQQMLPQGMSVPEKTSKRFSIRESYLAAQGNNNAAMGFIDRNNSISHSTLANVEQKNTNSNHSEYTETSTNNDDLPDSPPPLAFRSRRESIQDTGATRIQAAVRGVLTRMSFSGANNNYNMNGTIHGNTENERNNSRAIQSCVNPNPNPDLTQTDQDRILDLQKENLLPNDEQRSHIAIKSNAYELVTEDLSKQPQLKTRDTATHRNALHTPPKGAHSPVRSVGAASAISTNLRHNISDKGMNSITVASGNKNLQSTLSAHTPIGTSRGAPTSNQSRTVSSQQKSSVSYNTSLEDNKGLGDRQTVKKTPQVHSTTLVKQRRGLTTHLKRKNNVSTTTETGNATATPPLLLTPTCKENISSLLKLKIAKSFELLKMELNCLYILECDAGNNPTASRTLSMTSICSQSAVTKDLEWDGMGAIPEPSETQCTLPPAASLPRKLHSDDEIVSKLFQLCTEHIQLSRNMEDRLHTVVLNVDATKKTENE